MAFVRRSASFGLVKNPETPLSSHLTHDYLFDTADLGVLKAGGFPKLAEMGGIQGLAEAFRSSLAEGIYSDEINSTNGLAERRNRYGINIVPRKDPASFWKLCADALGDFMLQVLIVAGIISLILGSVIPPYDHWIEGLAILIAVAIVTLVSASNNYQKERQFRAIEEKEKERCALKRGGVEMEAIADDVCVGDIVILKQGDAIVADGIFVSGSDLQVDESPLTGEADSIAKDFEHPFLLSGTAVLDGEGVMLVIAVGVHSTRGQISAALDSDSEATPLQERLEVLANQVGVVGSGVAVVLFVVLVITWVVRVSQGDRNYVGKLMQILDFFIIAITLIVVAVPEGLPLAVTISLAYSMNKMLLDNNLVRVLSACETMGNATMICSDKTGTLTLNQMTVSSVVIGGRLYRDKLPLAADLSAHVLNVLLPGEALNSKVFAVPHKPGDAPDAIQKYSGGNQTACALLRWAITLGCDYEAIRKRVRIEKAYPFNSAKKQGSVLVKNGPGSRLFVKGAVEQILSRTRFWLSPSGKAEAMDADTRAKFTRYIDAMTRTGLRCIGIAYQDFGPIQLNEAGEIIDHDDSQEAYVLVAITGIKDPLRPGVQQAVRTCQQAGIVVRMVTGDHIETAKFIARDACILTSPHQIAMTGPDFRAMTEAEKAEVIPRLRVLARSSPLDKEVLVRWLKNQGQVVAVTGDGTNDAPALKEADVGLAMGIQGTDVAKKASSIIILDDDFATIVKSVMWGRSVYDNIKKFIQFQITINFVALLLTLIGAMDPSGEVPLTAVQLLWVNLIMDTLAALALGTEIPTMELLNRKPYSKDSPLITKVMWRNIIGQGLFQLSVLLVVLHAGNRIWDIKLHSPVHLTLIFNIFVLLQLFNEINSRKCNGETNVFENIFANNIFGGVLIVSFLMQVLMVELFGPFASTVPLSWQMWLECIAIGFLSLPVGFLVRLIKVDNTSGQIEIDPRDFEVVPFPDDSNGIEDELRADERGDKDGLAALNVLKASAVATNNSNSQQGGAVRGSARLKK